MMPKRTYHFDRHVSDVILRLLLAVLLLPSVLIAWYFWIHFDEAIESVFERNISLNVQLSLKRTNKTGFSAMTLFQEAETRRLRDGKGVLSYPEYLVEAGLDDKDPDLAAVRLYIFMHRLAMYLLATVFTLVSLFLLYLLVVSYGTGGSSWRLNRYVFSFFNTDFEAIAPRVGVGELTARQRALFDICFRRALASDRGEFLFVSTEFYRALHPKGEVEPDAMARLYREFRDLAQQIHRFSFVRGADRVTREYCLVHPVKDKVTTVELVVGGVEQTFFKAGVFQIHPRLFTALRSTYGYVEKLSPLALAVDHDAHPYAYAVYNVVFSYRMGIQEGRWRELLQRGMLTLPLLRLLDEAGIAVPDDNLRDFLADVHADLNHLVSKKVIDSWEVRDQGIPLARDWFESIQTYSFDPDRREFKTGLEILANKVYYFSVGLPSYPGLPAAEIYRLPPGTGTGDEVAQSTPPPEEAAPVEASPAEAEPAPEETAPTPSTADQTEQETPISAEPPTPPAEVASEERVEEPEQEQDKDKEQDKKE